jgi:hypothetical protein
MVAMGGGYECEESERRGIKQKNNRNFSSSSLNTTSMNVHM